MLIRRDPEGFLRPEIGSEREYLVAGLERVADALLAFA